MALPLRLYPLKDQQPAQEIQPATVRMELGDLLPVLAYAHQNNYAWIKDFFDDQIIITADFYEMVRAFSKQLPGA